MQRMAILGVFVLASACSADDGSGEELPAIDVGDPVTSVDGESGDGSSGDGSSGDGDTGDGDTGDGDGDPGDGDPGDGDGGNIKFDLAALPDNSTDCQQGGNNEAFSYIWVANSAQGSISKINTETMIEEGRYRVRPDSAGSPSRTSVNLSGDVAVANRLGGVTKVYARIEDCEDSNGQPGIQTSSGPNDMLAWGDEECIAWHTPMNVNSQRPIAWDQGQLNEGNCTSFDAKVWTATATAGAITVWRHNGDDGSIEEMTPIVGTTASGYGPYGGGVDGNKDFWFMHRDSSPYPLVRVDGDSLDYTIWQIPQPVNPYGFAIDPEGRPWIAGFQGGIARFDPDTETWDVNTEVTGVGMMGDGQGTMWIARYPWDMEGVSALDTETMELVDFIEVPSSLGKGVSIDFNGYVWLVDMTNSAFRIDPQTHQFVTYAGLTGPYTYSDMTGFGLASVSNPQG
jgi:hypothetical protein